MLVSQTGFPGEKDAEVYVHGASVRAEAVWYGIRSQGAHFGLRVITPARHRRVAAGILSGGRDTDVETPPFQVKAYQVPRGNQPITDWAPDFWLITEPEGAGSVT